MIKRALSIEVTADTGAPKPGDRVGFTLTLANAGAGHKIPTGDPDRFFTVEFIVEDRQGKVLERQSSTMGRWILWQPAIVELYDNRLLPLVSRDYKFDYRLPEQAEGLILKTRVQYHILTDGQHEMLRNKFGLTANDPYRFVIDERTFPLSSDLGEVLKQEAKVPVISRREEGHNCTVNAEG
jgi:hypothetical protein